ncbi:MAG: phage major capsid protein [Phycisphaeraceae bacterium]
MSLSDKEIQDLVTGTLDNLGRMKFQQIAQNLQDYEVMGRWLRKDRVAFDSGIGIKRTLMTKLPGSARHVGLYEEDELNVVDLLKSMVVPWRHATTNWAFERRETLENRGKALVVNVIKPRRAGAMIDLIEQLEDKAFTAPSEGNDVDPYGLPYWIVKNANEGFNGGTPSGHSTVAGVDLDEVPKFKNYTAQYTDVSKSDLIKKMRTAYRKIRFKSPVSIPDFRRGKGDRYRIYVGESTISDMEDLGEAQNENLGRDLASMDGVMTFRRNPIIWIPKLDEDTTDPVYMTDHGTFYPVILKGDYLRETDPAKAAKQHNVFEVHVDLSYNYVCVDRRRNAVLSK